MQSVSRLVDQLNQEAQVSIVTADRDLGESRVSDVVPVNRWVVEDGTTIFRINPKRLWSRRVRRLAASAQSEVWYLNSLFDFRFSIVPVLAAQSSRSRKQPILTLAPRGELYPSALANRALKKRIFLNTVRAIGLYRRVRWHATTAEEADQIRAWFGSGAEVRVVQNIGAAPVEKMEVLEKEGGRLNIVFLSRIVRNKGLHLLIDALQKVEGDVYLEIYGPIEDVQYWKQCRRRLADLSPSIKVRYGGVLDRHQITTALKCAHIFVLPTYGENFGHVVSEALAHGKPVVVSDKTPWNELARRGAGAEVSLDPPELSIVIQKYVDMQHTDYQKSCEAAWEYSLEVQDDPDRLAAYRRLLKIVNPADEGEQ